MTFMPLLTAGLETALNQVLYRDRGLKAARQRLKGKSLVIELAEVSSPLTLIFSEKQVDVMGEWNDVPDCSVKMGLGTLHTLRQRDRLTGLIRSGELEVEGDLQVVQQFSALIDLAELDPAEYLAPWTGDIVAQGIGQFTHRATKFIRLSLKRKQGYLSQALTEEWQVALGGLELAWFAGEVDAVTDEVAALQRRLDALEEK